MAGNHNYSISQRLALKEFMNGKVERHLDDLKRAIVVLQAHNTKRNFEIEQARTGKLAMKAHYEARIGEFLTNEEILIAEINALKSALDAADSLIIEFSNENNNLRYENDELNMEVANLSSTIENLERENSDLSWRISDETR